tara:strand:- start:360 stop:1880 length:1521 start_codon:yes stop_codon:yes gene_type:complete
MNKLKQIPFRLFVLLLCLISTAVQGQKQSKTYKEVFITTPETVLVINTSNADLTFETWDKNQIEIQATIALEGASKEEIERYFKTNAIDINGNSQKVTLTTGVENNRSFKFHTGDLNQINFDQNFRFEMDSLFHENHVMFLDSLQIGLSILEDMPPMPSFPQKAFDYKAFEKDGETYLIEWQKDFSKGFDKEYEEKMEAWSKRMEEREKKMEERQLKMEKAQMERQEKMEEAQMERQEKIEEARAKQMELREKAREDRQRVMEDRREAMAMAKANSGHNIIISRNNGRKDRPNIFYYSADGESRNYKVKKTIKIKMPKTVKIQMNVRHGEVKLAQNTKNINATLSYSNLHAYTIDGEETTIVASYSPVTVQKWNFGQLQADYSDKVDLQEVVNLRLNATSSEVTIERLMDKAYIKSSFGPLKINYISNDFTDMDISLQNAELHCKAPTTAYTIYVNGTSSTLAGPVGLKLEKTKNQNTVVSKGYHLNKNSAKSIVVNAKYSDVVFD